MSESAAVWQSEVCELAVELLEHGVPRATVEHLLEAVWRFGALRSGEMYRRVDAWLAAALEELDTAPRSRDRFCERLRETWEASDAAWVPTIGEVAAVVGPVDETEVP